MQFYLGIKYKEDLSNKALIEKISCIVEEEDHEIVCVHKDLEDWGRNHVSSEDLMMRTMEMIDDCDALLIEFSEKGVGLGIEAGYAFAKSIPVYVLLPKGKLLSTTMNGICKKCFEYETTEDIVMSIKEIGKTS